MLTYDYFLFTIIIEWGGVVSSKLSLYDRVNLYEIPELISRFAKLEKNNSINTREKVINVLLGQINLPFKGDYITKLLTFIKKYASAETPKFSDEMEYIIESLTANSNINEVVSSFYSGCKRLVICIDIQSNSNKVYETMLSYCNFINSDGDLPTNDAINMNSIKAKTEFLYEIFKHAIINYRISMPKFYCYRMYNEALTLSPGSEMQIKLYKTVVDICKESQQKSEIACNAAIQYANLIYDSDYIEAYNYFLFATSKLPSAYWEIAFLIEQHHLPKRIVVEFNSYLDISFRDELSSVNIVDQSSIAVSDFKKTTYCPLDYDRQDEEFNCLVSFKAYWIIANKYMFTKALNSIGKHLLTKKVGICKYQHNHVFVQEEASVEEAKQYLKKAMRLGNTNAMVNLANYYFGIYKKDLLNEQDQEKMIQLLATAADDFSEPKACSLLGDYYYMNNNLIIASSFYKKSISHTDKDGYNYFMLGRISDIHCDKIQALNYYSEALSRGHFDAAYYTAIIWVNESFDTYDLSLKRYKAKEHIEKYLSLFSTEIKFKALDLLSLLESTREGN